MPDSFIPDSFVADSFSPDQITPPHPAARAGFLESLLSSLKSGAEGLVKSTPPGMLYTAAQDMLHPDRPATNPGTQIGQSVIREGAKSKEAFQQGRYPEAAGHGLAAVLPAASVVPGVGPIAAGLAASAPAIASIAEELGGNPPMPPGMQTQLEGPNRDPNPAGAAGVATGLGMQLAAPYGPPIARAAMAGGKRVVTDLAGITTGTGGKAMRQALDSPTPDLTNAMRGGTSETDVVGHGVDALNNLKGERGASYRDALHAISQQQPAQQLDLQPVREALDSAMQDFNVKIVASTKKGQPFDIDFSRSTVQSPEAQKQISSIAKDVLSWGTKPDDLTPLGVDVLKRRIADFWSDSGQARGFVERLRQPTRDVLSQVQGYDEMTRDYSEASDLIKQVQDELSLNKNTGTAMRKLQYGLNQNNGYREALIDRLQPYANVDLKGELAGMTLSSLVPRGLAKISLGGEFLWMLLHGNLSPEAVAASVVTSPRVLGELMTAMAKTRPFIGGIGTAGKATAKSAPAGAPMSQSEEEKPFLKENLPDYAKQHNVTIDQAKRELESMGYAIK